MLGVVAHPRHTLDTGQVDLVLLHDDLLLAVVLVEDDGGDLGRIGHVVDHRPAPVNMLVWLHNRSRRK